MCAAFVFVRVCALDQNYDSEMILVYCDDVSLKIIIIYPIFKSFAK